MGFGGGTRFFRVYCGCFRVGRRWLACRAVVLASSGQKFFTIVAVWIESSIR